MGCYTLTRGWSCHLSTNPVRSSKVLLQQWTLIRMKLVYTVVNSVQRRCETYLTPHNGFIRYESGGRLFMHPLNPILRGNISETLFSPHKCPTCRLIYCFSPLCGIYEVLLQFRLTFKHQHLMISVPLLDIHLFPR